mmetsp:Transcript_42128/g.111006  ORF Transcript_42128/g.111006 Transcript_42128/m.111006 type:complete len:311 (+) Transcript_42128:233-1165(+)
MQVAGAPDVARVVFHPARRTNTSPGSSAPPRGRARDAGATTATEASVYPSTSIFLLSIPSFRTATTSSPPAHGTTVVGWSLHRRTRTPGTSLASQTSPASTRGWTGYPSGLLTGTMAGPCAEREAGALRAGARAAAWSVVTATTPSRVGATSWAIAQVASHGGAEQAAAGRWGGTSTASPGRSCVIPCCPVSGKKCTSMVPPQDTNNLGPESSAAMVHSPGAISWMSMVNPRSLGCFSAALTTRSRPPATPGTPALLPCSRARSTATVSGTCSQRKKCPPPRTPPLTAAGWRPSSCCVSALNFPDAVPYT